MKRALKIGGILFAGFMLGIVTCGFLFLSSGNVLMASAPALAGNASYMEMDASKAAPGYAMAPPAEELAEGGGGEDRKVSAKKRRQSMPMAKPMPLATSRMEPESELADEFGRVEAEAAPSRAWFPETFLFEPLVVTDAAGQATVPVRVPDRLTRWRVLALGHSRSGAQAGAVTSFAGTLPTYVDPVVPAFLRTGDTVRLPVQVVNTTGGAVEQPLKLSAEGAVVEGNAARTVRVPAQGSVVEYVTLKATQPGPVSVRASLGTTDAVVRGFDVVPTGRPVGQTRGGSLAAPRTLTLEGPAEVEAGSERVRLLVYPGALGVLRAELAAASGRGGVAEDAYALLLSGRAPTLLKTLGETADTEALKAMSMVAGQRVLRAGRSPDVPTAALLAQAALTHPDNPVLSRLGERLAAQVANAQRPDGTCQGADGWTLQRLLVATADCAQAVRAASSASKGGSQRAAAFSARALGAFERNLSQVQEGYTAAAVLASGGVTGSLQERLREQVRQALKKREDGAVSLPVEPGVVRADGTAPPEVEATALAVLALAGDAKAPMADLGTALLSGYQPGLGWGDGRTNLLCLQAAMALFSQPLPSRVQVVLERDGKVLSEGTFDAKALRDVLALEAAAPGSAGAHTWTVRAEPAVPGLGFSLSLSAYVPWKSEKGQGLELAVKVPAEAKVGQPVEVALQAATPAGMALELRYALPAGAQADTQSLERLVAEGKVSSYEVEDGALTLSLPPRDAGVPFQASFRVVPTLAGTLQGGASSLFPVERPDLISYVPPALWTVR
ncbi:alpha-2-macroglobulin family protein [Hyalangium rubrum]|uniref:Alpha-2-macroglobulin family protein n=1 Tax=Hyalangium rubrum TaxID=3103134 RepID=A0ABU5HHB2_9BACT|nr:alpha-2-macroglobulin family protein [Hyalangium sp. s54d21]MDY7232228.1 alpha-2-macroglobulin family protein [Hyalangium sp. s54d21]